MATTHRFTLQLEGLDDITDQQLSALFAAGCDDGTFGKHNGTWLAEFDRTAKRFDEAVGTAIRQIETAVSELRVVRLVDEHDDLVTASEIARRAELSREAIRLLANGKRGSNTFPRPRAVLGKAQRLWYWPDVAKWFTRERHTRIRTELDEHAAFVRALNAALELRRLSSEVPRRERATVAGVLKEAENALA